MTYVMNVMSPLAKPTSGRSTTSFNCSKRTRRQPGAVGSDVSTRCVTTVTACVTSRASHSAEHKTTWSISAGEEASGHREVAYPVETLRSHKVKGDLEDDDDGTKSIAHSLLADRSGADDKNQTLRLRTAVNSSSSSALVYTVHANNFCQGPSTTRSSKSSPVTAALIHLIVSL